MSVNRCSAGRPSLGGAAKGERGREEAEVRPVEQEQRVEAVAGGVGCGKESSREGAAHLQVGTAGNMSEGLFLPFRSRGSESEEE